MKENSQRRLNNNNVPIKHTQGSLVSSQGLRYPVSCLRDTETPTRWKKLTTCDQTIART